MKNPIEARKIHQEGPGLSSTVLHWKAKEDTTVTLPCFGIQHDKVQ